MKLRNVVLLFITLICALPLAAQTGNCNQQVSRTCTDSQTITTSGASITIQNNGGLVPSFEEIIVGSPSTISIIIKGCGLSSTCDILDTYTTLSNTLRAPVISKVYNYYTVTASWTGSGVSVKINTTITSSRLNYLGGGVTASNMQSALSGQTGCTTVGYSWNPATNTCTPSSGGAAASFTETDSWNSTSTISSNWTQVQGTWQANNSTGQYSYLDGLQPTSLSNGGAAIAYTKSTDTWNQNQSVTVGLSNIGWSATDTIAPTVEISGSGGTLTYYTAYTTVGSTNTDYIMKYSGGVYTTLATALGTGVAYATFGYTATLSYNNGVLTYYVSGQPHISVTDTSLPAGVPGMAGFVANQSGEAAFWSATSYGTPNAQQIVDSLIGPSGIYITDKIPSNPGGNNVIIGNGGTGGSLSATGDFAGAQGNVIIGFGTAVNATTPRSSVIIGVGSAVRLTSSGTLSPEDGLINGIGASAFLNCTSNCLDVNYMGEDAFIAATSMYQTIGIGNHVATGVLNSTHDTFLGDRVLAGTPSSNYLSTDETIVGAMGEADAASNSTLIGNTSVGVHGLDNIDGSIAGNGIHNVNVGWYGGYYLRKGSYNTFLGDGTTNNGNNSPYVDGSYNVCIGVAFASDPTCEYLGTGNENIVINSTGPKSGSNNIVMMQYSGPGGGTGSNNIMMMSGAAQRAAVGINNVVIMGPNAGQHATVDGEVAVGGESGLNFTGSQGTFIGQYAGFTWAAGGATSGTAVTAVGDTSCFTVGTGSGDECLGANADIAAGLYNAAEIGGGQNTIAYTLAFHGASFFNYMTDSLIANLYQGRSTAPSGSCSTIGWAFSQDGHATFCNGTTWASKI
jgi:hypothetical protein